MNTSGLLQLLRAYFRAPEYAMFTDVRNASGFSASRSADAVVMSLWPSRGLKLYGIEVKADRGDWLREKKNPEKAEAVFKYCDGWYLVTGLDVALPAEIPEPWGWLCLNRARTKLELEKGAPPLTPEPMTRHFLGALLRRASEQTVDAAALAAAKDAGRKEGEQSLSYRHKQAESELEELRNQLAAFREASGIAIDRYTWDAGKIGEAVKFLLQGGAAERMQQLSEQAASIAKAAGEAAKQLSICYVCKGHGEICCYCGKWHEHDIICRGRPAKMVACDRCRPGIVEEQEQAERCQDGRFELGSQ